jgi:hypothetical protein
MKKILFYLFIVVGLNANAQAHLEWLNKLATTVTRKIEVDKSGNVYIVGELTGSADLDPSINTASLTSLGLRDGFVAKYNSNGQYQWAFRFGSIYDETAVSLVIDANANLYVTGFFQGTVDMDPSAASATLSSTNVEDIFIAKYNSSGQYQWAKQIGGSGIDIVTSIDLDNNNNILLSGHFTSQDFDTDLSSSSSPTFAAAGYDAFVAKFDPNGNNTWAFSFGDSSTDNAKGVKSDAAGNVFVTGYFEGAPDFDPGPSTTTLTSNGSYSDAFIAKYTSAGNFVWCGNITNGPEADVANSLDLDAADNMYVVGYFKDTCDFDPGAGLASYSTTSGYLD